MDALQCAECKAQFGPQSLWRPLEAPPPPEPRSRLGTVFLIAVGFAVLNLVLLGLPGGIIFTIGDLFATMVLGLAPLHGDSLWPISIATGFLWPACIPVAYGLAFGTELWKQGSRTVAFIVMLALGAVVISAVLHQQNLPRAAASRVSPT
jgi:hypothetical protein